MCLDVKDDVGNIFPHTGDRRELVQDTFDLDRGDGGTLKRGQQHAAQRVAESETKAALKRFGNHGRDPLRIVARLDVELVRLNQLLPILLDHVL